MSRVLIVSKTRMREDKVCVGGIDIDKRASLRLLNEIGWHEDDFFCEYEIGDMWDITYVHNNNRPLPHGNEDVNVLTKSKMGVLLGNNVSMLDVLNIIKFRYYKGSIENIFNGLTKRTGRGKMYVSDPEVPDHSTCFWVCDKDLTKFVSQYGEKQRVSYYYPMPAPTYRILVPYVGLKQPVDCIPKGTLIRFSLAHWWSPDDWSDTEERCYLQLSGWY